MIRATHITKRLRGIRNAWHFYCALSLVITVLCGSFCIACRHPLTRRYAILNMSVKMVGYL
ncbi:DUF3265 domain-containing protein [Vibrio aestuarianus subsp. francensis]|nr:DUF3265 domain-containing protein [Vibrio aestuarianus]NLS59408.1 DUF3265 domain-containing protein [Vibrio aestuarianus subsp. francensis]